MYDYSKTSDDCIKCGKCKPVCTIFDISHDESQSPRGFIDLLGAYHRDDLELDKNAKKIFESCFLCTNCVDVCPIDLPVDTIIEQVRFDIGKKYGIAWYKKAFFWLLRHRTILDFMAKMGYVFQSCAIKIQKQREFATLRFSLPIIKKGRALPFAKSTSFLNTYPENIPAKNPPKKRQKVAIFIGCMANYTYLDTGRSLVEILQILNIDIFIPKKQLCCSAPAYFTGDFDTVNYLNTTNIEYFESFIDDVDAIIIPEATCTAMIKEDWERFFYDNIEYRDRAKELNKKIFMATQWINDNTDIKDRLKLSNKKFSQIITYHDPCHAKKVLGVYREPRDLITQNYVIKEMSNSDVCCGFGGVTIQTDHYHLAKKAGKTKADIIIATNAEIVSAECSACRMQITNSLYQEKSNIDFKHPLELIREGLDEN
jgi:glycolate oxidase iron-sulfur subunit